MEVEILFQNTKLRGDLEIPDKAIGIIIFTQEDEGRKQNFRNVFITRELNEIGLATLKIDLLNEEENKEKNNRLNIDLLTERLIGVTKWCMGREETQGLKIGYWGTSVGSAAVLSAAAYWGTKIKAVVSLEGRTDLAMEELDLIEAPLLLIVEGENREVVDVNRKAYIKTGCIKKMETISGATLLLEGKDLLEKITELTKNWFKRFLLEEGVE
jgi:dienelactone hydrolase